jgi:competence CoiA-like predicted nuclease
MAVFGRCAIATSENQPLDEAAAMSVQQKMVEHRENCEACKNEDLALKDGEVPTPAFAEIS